MRLQYNPASKFWHLQLIDRTARLVKKKRLHFHINNSETCSLILTLQPTLASILAAALPWPILVILSVLLGESYMKSDLKKTALKWEYHKYKMISFVEYNVIKDHPGDSLYVR